MTDLDLKKLREEKKLTQTELAKMVGVSLRTIQNYEKTGEIPEPNRSYLTDYFINGIEIPKLSVNKSDKNAIFAPNQVGVPYYEDIECTGNIMSMNSDYKEVPTFYINYEHFNDCTAYLTHVGDSMYPKYCSGEIIAVKRIFNLNVVLWGEAYLVVTNENANNLRTIKLVYQHEELDKIILRASNPNFKGDTVILKEDIVSMFIVKGKITRNQL